MSDEKQPSAVVVADNSAAGRSNHPAASEIDVLDGHLHVRRNGDVVAIYAPGAWKSARVEP